MKKKPMPKPKAVKGGLFPMPKMPKGMKPMKPMKPMKGC